MLRLIRPRNWLDWLIVTIPAVALISCTVGFLIFTPIYGGGSIRSFVKNEVLWGIIALAMAFLAVVLRKVADQIKAYRGYHTRLDCSE